MKYVISLVGRAGTTQSKASTDTAQLLTDAVTIPNGCISAVITCETNNVRIAFGTNPTQAGLGHLLYVGQSYKIGNPQAVRDFRFISAANGVHGLIQVTPETKMGA